MGNLVSNITDSLSWDTKLWIFSKLPVRLQNRIMEKKFEEGLTALLNSGTGRNFVNYLDRISKDGITIQIGKSSEVPTHRKRRPTVKDGEVLDPNGIPYVFKGGIPIRYFIDLFGGSDLPPEADSLGGIKAAPSGSSEGAAQSADLSNSGQPDSEGDIWFDCETASHTKLEDGINSFANFLNSLSETVQGHVPHT
jgi:hypothetical protein